MSEEINYKDHWKNFWIYFIIFTILLLCVNIFSNSFGWTDTGDYLGTAKGFTGKFITKIRSSHSWVYGLILSLPLKLIYSPIIIKLVNVIWLIIIGFYIYQKTKSRKAFLLYIFSPLVWFMAPWVTPILPTSFLILLSYNFFKKFESNQVSIENYKYLVFSGALLGLASIIWDTVIFFSFFFIISFFYNKTVKQLAIFLVSFMVLFSIRFLVDFILFGFPLFSLFRVFGGNLSAFLHLGSYTNLSYPLKDYLSIFIIISPLFLILIYRFIKENYKTHLQEIIFIILCFLLILQNPQTRYLMGIAPLLTILLYKKIHPKEIFWHISISIILIAYLLFFPIFFSNLYPNTTFFGKTPEYNIGKDIESIANDFPNQTFLAGNPRDSDLYMSLGMYYWGNQIKEIISWQDFDLWRRNETDFQRVRIESKQKNVKEIRKLWIEVGLSRTDNRTFEDIKYLISNENSTELPDFRLVKSYRVLNVFEKI